MTFLSHVPNPSPDPHSDLGSIIHLLYLSSAAHILSVSYLRLEVDQTIRIRASSAKRITLSHPMPHLLTIPPHCRRTMLSCLLMLALL